MRQFFLALGLVTMLIGCKPSAPIKKSSVSYSIDAEEVNLVPLKSALRRYKVVIRHTSQEVLILEGRPISKVTSMTIGQFARSWNDKAHAFNKHPPHATLIVYAPQKKGHLERSAVLLKLTKMGYDPKKDQLTFEATAMSSVSPYISGHPVQMADLIIEGKVKLKNGRR